MKHSNTIRRIISASLILVFALSITPVVFLHNLMANHKDISYVVKNKKGAQYSKAGINCNCINLVAEGQFLDTVNVLSIFLPKFISVFKNGHSATFFSRYHFYAVLRGPPVTA